MERNQNRSKSVFFTLFRFGPVLGALLVLSATAQAANLVVNTLNDDGHDGDGLCTLREALVAVNQDASFQDCAGTAFGADTITFSVTGTITLVHFLPRITDADALTIDGPGAANLTLSGDNSVPVLWVDSGATINLQDLRLANAGTLLDFGSAIVNAGTLTVSNSTFSGNKDDIGSDGGSGGAISSSGGKVTVSNSVFSDNHALNFGGGIEVSNTMLTVSNSTFSGNVTDLGGGGGIFTKSSTVTIINSTFSGNEASMGGAIGNQDGTVTVANSTFSGNSGSAGGGIANLSGTVNVINSTFSGNSSLGFGGGGILDIGGTTTLRNTLLANSAAGGNCATDEGTIGGGTISDGGGNLEDGATCGFADPTSMNNTAAGLDPAGLKDNGGPTHTIALCTGVDAPTAGCTGPSPAIDMGNNAVCAAESVNNEDQRGFDRPKDGDGDGTPVCDIGAFEVQPAGLTCNGKPVTIEGTDGNNVLRGTPGDDVIHGLGGHDVIGAGSGHDTVCGGEGNDAVSGGNGNDSLFGEGGRDALSGGNGNDALDGGDNRDACSGGSGTDTAADCEAVGGVP